MKFLSLCSGIEAASVAFNPLGWECVGVAEIEKFPCEVLKHHYPNVKNYGDITRFKEWDIKPGTVDVIIGGTPCQSFSVAGLRKGLADPRGNLALTFLAIVERLAPTWFVWENVPGVFSSWSDAKNRGQTKASVEAGETAIAAAIEAGFDTDTARGFGDFDEVDQSNDLDCFLAGIRELGYGCALASLDCQYNGLAQRRERVFVVGHVGGQWQRAAAVLFDRESMSWNPPPRRKTGEGTAADTSPCLGASGRGFERAGETRSQDPVVAIPINMQAAAKNGAKSPNMVGIGVDGDPAFTVNASDQHAVACAVRCGSTNAESHNKPSGLDENLICATITKNYARHYGRTAGNNGGVADGQLIPDVAWALQERDSKGSDSKGSDSSTKDGHLLPSESGFGVRRLTPTECARLMGFPDDYLSQVTYNGKCTPADGPMYRAFGNSMAVPVVNWIGRRIELVHNLMKRV